MRPPVQLALALWAVLALAVFSVTFDWQTRLAGWQFVRQQIERRAQGAPLATIEDGFRPMVRAAAWQSSLWLLAVFAGGSGAVLMAARRESNNSW
jgi:hypothetical protein